LFCLELLWNDLVSVGDGGDVEVRGAGDVDANVDVDVADGFVFINNTNKNVRNINRIVMIVLVFLVMF